MSPRSIVEDLDVIEHIRSSQLACFVDAFADALLLQAAKERLCDRVVPAIATTAHASFQTVGFQEVLPIMAAILAALIGVNQHWPTRFASPHGHQERIQDKVLGDPGLH